MEVNRKDLLAIGRIIARSISGAITATEQVKLDDWLKDNANRQLYKELTSADSISKTLPEFENFDANEGYQRLSESIGKSQERFRWYWAAVAVLVVCISTTLTVYLVGWDAGPPSAPISSLHDDIAPGRNRATLTLADGRAVALDESRLGIVIGKDGITYDDGDLLTEGSENDGHSSDVNVLELTTPNGGTDQDTLSDGTKVWLNAASKLTYPLYFSDTERVVTLVGEAFFSVNSDTKKPFKVITERHEVHVLGTEFNVTAYPDEEEAKTTLVEGKVRLSLMGLKRRRRVPVFNGARQVELVAGQQGTIRGDCLIKGTVDVDPYVAWKEGYFYFKQTPLEEILRQVARWYDVEVVYEGGVPHETFSGDIRRDVSLRGLLDILQHSTINVTLEGRRLIVRK